MNVFDEVQSARPEVAPMPLAQRRMIREGLFGVGHGDSASTIGSRSESGAVTATAPHGTRRPIQKQPRATGSLARLGAGLLVFGVAGFALWSFTSRDDEVETTTTSTTIVEPTVATTAPPVTTAPPLVRTGVTASAPVVLPATLLPVDDVVVAPAGAGSSSALVSAPDGSMIWIAEFDGEPVAPDGLDVRQVGAIGVGVAADRAEDDLASYRPLVPCGFVVVNDAPGQPLDRPEMVTFFSSMSIDGSATIDVTLPSGWSVFDLGPSATAYIARFQIPAGEETRTLSLSQAPGGTFAQLTFGGRQLAPITLLGGPGFIDAAPADPNVVSVFWRDGSTVFNASSADLTLEEIEAFIESLEPSTTDEWHQRFGTAEPVAPEPSGCTTQPRFGPTLDP